MDNDSYPPVCQTYLTLSLVDEYRHTYTVMCPENTPLHEVTATSNKNVLFCKKVTLILHSHILNNTMPTQLLLFPTQLMSIWYSRYITEGREAYRFSCNSANHLLPCVLFNSKYFGENSMLLGIIFIHQHAVCHQRLRQRVRKSRTKLRFATAI